MGVGMEGVLGKTWCINETNVILIIIHTFFPQQLDILSHNGCFMEGSYFTMLKHKYNSLNIKIL